MFLVWKGEATERLEPKSFLLKYRVNDEKINNSKFSKYHLKQINKLISDGTHFTPKYTEEGVKFLSVKDVRPFEINYNNSKFIAVEEANFLDKRCKPQKGDVLLTKIGATFGFASVINSEERFQIFVSLALLRPKQDLVLPEYLALCLNSKISYLQFERIIKGAGVPDLHLEDIRNVKIPIPSIEIQKQILEKFNKAYIEKKAKETEAREKLASVDALVLDALGIKLPEKEDDALERRIFFAKSNGISSGRFDPNALHPERINAIKAVQSSKHRVEKLHSAVNFVRLPTTENKIMLPYVGLENIQSNKGIYLPTTDVEEFGTANVFQNGQVLFPKLRPYLNKVFYATFNGICSTEFYVLDGLLVSNSYLTCFLRTSVIVSQTKRLMTGNTLPRLQTKDVESLLIPVPPPEVQTEIAQRVEAIYAESKRLREEGAEILQRAKADVEAMILGESSEYKL